MRAALATVAGGLAVIAGSLGTASASRNASGPNEYVSTTGTDTGDCTTHPCATINYAISQATPGETIHVAAGKYNQTVNINKAVTLVGAGVSTTTLDGTGLDPSNSGYYGVVYIGNAGGIVTVKGFTITNPVPYAYTGGEPMAVVLADKNPTDILSITNNAITEGTADSNAGTDFPIGIDSFVNPASTYINSNTISGFFQGALLEDNGLAKINSNKFTNLITGTDTSTNPPTVYPAEGLFFLADEGGTYANQDASGNHFAGYSGYGIAESAGYTGGYVTAGCIANGSITTALNGNRFALTGGQKATAISLQVSGPANSLTGQVNYNKGYVTAPSHAIETQSVSVPPTPPNTNCGAYSSTPGGGGSLDITQDGDAINQKSASTQLAAAGKQVGGLHTPRRPRSH